MQTSISLMRTGSDLMATFEAYLARKNLSQGRFLTLIVMNRHPEDLVGPSELASQVGVKPATMTGLLDGLEHAGMVRRVPHPTDRRKVSVRLSDKGRSVLDAMLPDYYQHVASIMTDLTDAERKTLRRLLTKVNGKLGDI